MPPLPWWLPFGPVPEVDAHELSRRLERAAPLMLLDVRTAAEFTRGRIQGSVNVPIGSLSSRLPDLQVDAGVTVVAICRSAHRSVPAVRLLRKRGHADAVQLAGGMLAWWQAELPTISG